MLAHVAGIPVEEALLAAPALLAGVTVIAGYVRATVALDRTIASPRSVHRIAGANNRRLVASLRETGAARSSI